MGICVVEVVFWLLISLFARQLVLPFWAWSVVVGGAIVGVGWLAADPMRDGADR